MSRELKYSGIPWIGDIPKDWKTKRLKNVGFLYGGLTGKSGDDFISEDDESCSYMRFIPFTNIFNNDVINPNQLYKVRIEEGEEQNLVSKNDILFLMSSEDYDGVGKPAIIEQEISNLGLNSFCKGFRITDNDTFPKFMFYKLNSHIMRELVRQEAKGFIRINLRQDKLSACPIFLPSLSEQQKITSFLDKKCAEVDEMVALQEKMIEELKAYKQSVITEAVTKGLNPNAPMKDSGIEWIGEIPEHWNIARLKYYATIDSGDAISNEDINNEGEYPVYGGGEIMGYFSNYNTVEDKIIIGRVGARCGCITMPNQKCWASDNALVLNSSMPLKYTYYLLIAVNLNNLNTSNAQPLITSTKVKNVYIPINSTSEQQQIANYLDDKCSAIDNIISIKQQKIEELKDYKKSIIYEYVTGKKEVED